ncbi:MAG: 16S rRNA (guanine(527)-N(7))-methyltransferase RsmG [Patescibacteria group bacterium]|nr:16S rRNA (guanine(527)-N(7))-methyltransferase RsmG [Patescibacteria group bacterium]
MLAKNIEQKLIDIFLEKNSQINLSAIRDEQGVRLRHIQDSLIPFEKGFVKLKPNQRVMDLGTGGGFPIMPLALQYPDVHFTGLDSVGKKVIAVESLIRQMGIPNIEMENGRIEDFAHDESFREMFDLVISRALAQFSTALEYMMPFAAPGGYVAIYQGPRVNDDLVEKKNVIRKLGGELVDLYNYRLDDEDIDRYFLVIKKLGKTPMHYPRAVGIPKSQPL